MNEKLLYCEECEDLVPESEVQDLFKTGKPFHTYTHTVNAYKNQRPGTIGYCPVEERVYCGQVREPTDQEYFIHHTCNSNANTRTNR